jgi:hypothetical protein
MITRSEFLKEARKKYFFNDPSVPSFRIMEWHDDNGKYIEEQELWRPLNSHSQDGENKKLKVCIIMETLCVLT